jgi:hypothetical protein
MISVGAKRGETLASDLPFTLIKIESSRARILLKCSLAIVKSVSCNYNILSYETYI